MSATSPKRWTKGKAVAGRADQRLAGLVRLHIRAPMASPALRVQPHIGVMIAGDGGDALRRPKRAQPFSGKHELLRQAEIDEVAGHRDVVRLPLDDVLGQHIEDVAAMHELPPAMPIHIAEHALAEEVATARPGHRAQVNVGQMGESEQGGRTMSKGGLRIMNRSTDYTQRSDRIFTHPRAVRTQVEEAPWGLLRMNSILFRAILTLSIVGPHRLPLYKELNSD